MMYYHILVLDMLVFVYVI